MIRTEPKMRTLEAWTCALVLYILLSALASLF